jgi:hypothetical protein
MFGFDSARLLKKSISCEPIYPPFDVFVLEPVIMAHLDVRISSRHFAAAVSAA